MTICMKGHTMTLEQQKQIEREFQDAKTPAA